MSVDCPTLDLIENALLNVRFEMDEVVRRAAMSPMIREQHDEFPMVCDRHGRMVVGQFGSYISEMLETFISTTGASSCRSSSASGTSASRRCSGT